MLKTVEVNTALKSDQNSWWVAVWDPILIFPCLIMTRPLKSEGGTGVGFGSGSQERRDVAEE
jgi:hypothetical protein